MTRIGADGAPYNGRTGQATRQAGSLPTVQVGEDVRVVDRAARSTVSAALAAMAPRSPRGTVILNLLALASTIVILGAGVALAGALMWPKTYAARAEVLFPINQEQPTGSALREDRNLTTQLLLIDGRAVLSPIAMQQNRPVDELQGQVTASILQSSEIIDLQVTDRSQGQALQTAQAVLTNYLALSQAGQPTLRQRLETAIVGTNTALTAAQAKLSAQETLVTAGTAKSETVAPLQNAVQAQQSRQQQLQAQLDAVNLAPVAQLLTPPYAAGAVSPRPMFATLAGGLVGLVVAGVVVAVVARNRTPRGDDGS
ncbi:MAG TPA: hypothetical protein VGJ13_07460 [Pseudonocardiaceae bacterium]